MRATVPRSYKSVLNTMLPTSPPCVLHPSSSSISNLAVFTSSASSSFDSAHICDTAHSPVSLSPISPQPLASSHVNIVWNTGVLLESRSGATASTTFTNGTSACSTALCTASPVLFTTSLKLAAFPSACTRTASVFTKYPTTSWIAGWSRFAYGIPTTTSSCPLHFPNTTAHAARAPRIVVTPQPMHKALRAAPAASLTHTSTLLPFELSTAGRNRSDWSSSTGRSSPKVCCQYCTCGAMRSSSPRSWCCHSA